MFKRFILFAFVFSILVSACLFSVSASSSSSSYSLSFGRGANSSVTNHVNMDHSSKIFYKYSLSHTYSLSLSFYSEYVQHSVTYRSLIGSLPPGDTYFYGPPVYFGDNLFYLSGGGGVGPDTINLSATPVSVSDLPSDVVSQFPDYSRVTYTSGQSYNATVQLSRQSWMSLSPTPTFFSSYPISLHYPWTSSGFSDFAPEGTFIVTQYYDVSLPSGYFSLSFGSESSPSLDVSYYGVTPGDLLQFSPRQYDVTYSGSYSNWTIPSDLDSHFTTDGYFYLPSPTHYVFSRDITFDLSNNLLVSTADLSMSAPALPTITITPFTRNVETLVGSDIPSINTGSSPSDGSTEISYPALLEALSNFYIQYQLNTHSSGYAGLSVYDSSRDFYDLESTYLPNVNTLELLALQTYNNSRNEIGILNLLNRISRSVLPISNISNVFQQSLSSQNEILYSQLSYLQGWLSDFKTNWGLAYLTDKDFYQSQESSNAQLHSDIWTLISTVRNLQSGDSATRPWEDFEDNYISQNSDVISGVGSAVDSSDALDVLQDLSSGVKSGDFDNSSLSSSAGVVSGSSESPMYGLWSDDTVDAFNGDVDSWYSNFEVRVTSW